MSSSPGLPFHTVAQTAFPSQRRQKRREAFLASVRPQTELSSDCLCTESNPTPPIMWLGLPVSLDMLYKYVVGKGNPHGADLGRDKVLIPGPALDLLRERLNTKRIYHVKPLIPYTKEMDRAIVFKCNLWRSARNPQTDEDKQMADMLRIELGLAPDHPCVWHFSIQTYERFSAVRPTALALLICNC